MADVFPGATLVQTDGFFARRAPSPQEAFSVVHHTASTRSAQSEVEGRQIASGGVTATFFVDPDGTPWQQLGSPLQMAPWTNGILNRPDISNPRIASLVASGQNPNLWSLVTVENVAEGNMTIEQERTTGAIIAHYHAAAGLTISRETVIGHYQLDSVNRPNCPGTDKGVLQRIVDFALGAEMYGWKQAGKPIGTFRFVGDHQLISPLDVTVRYPRPDGSTFQVIAAVDLKDANGKAVDITGSQPPRNDWDQLYMVDDPSFGIAAYALRQDGIFTPAATDTGAAFNEGLAAAQAAVEAVPER